MSPSAFEKLLAQYTLGAIDFITYRNLRAELIRKITNNEYKTDITIPKSETTQPVQPLNQENIQKSEFQIPTLKKRNSFSDSAATQYSIIIILLIIGGISWYFSEEKQTVTINEEKPQTQEKQISELRAKPQIDEPFIVAFNNKTQWDTESISNFLVQWQSLTPSQQKIARQSNSFTNLSDSLREKINDQRTLKNNKAISTSRKESLLIWFASQLSIAIN